MIPALKFNIRNQNIQRVDSFLPVKNSKNYLYAEFNFITEDWAGKQKTAIFKSESGEFPAILKSTNTCQVPIEVLRDDYFSVSVFGGDLITTDEATVKLYESGYRPDIEKPPSPDLYEQVLEELSNKVTTPESGKVGQILEISEVDEAGKPTKFIAVDKSTGENVGSLEFTDDGQGNVTIKTSQGTDISFTDDGEGNVTIGV